MLVTTSNHIFLLENGERNHLFLRGDFLQLCHNRAKSIAGSPCGDPGLESCKNPAAIRRFGTHPGLIRRWSGKFNSQLKFAGWSADSSPLFLIWRRPVGHRPIIERRSGATVRNVAEKIRRSSNGDPAIAVRWPHDVIRAIERRSADAYKGPTPGGDRAIPARSSVRRRRMIERLQRMIGRGSGDFHSGSLTAYKSRTLVEELTRLTDPKVATQYVVRNIHIFPLKYAPRKEAKAQERETTWNKERRASDGQCWCSWSVYKSRTCRQCRWRHRTPWTLKAVHKRAGQTDCCVLRPTPVLLWYVSQGLQKQEQEKGPGPAVRPDHVHEW